MTDMAPAKDAIQLLREVAKNYGSSGKVTIVVETGEDESTLEGSPSAMLRFAAEIVDVVSNAVAADPESLAEFGGRRTFMRSIPFELVDLLAPVCITCLSVVLEDRER